MSRQRKMSIYEGASFPSFRELEKSVRAFEKETHAVYYRRRANKIASFMESSPCHFLAKLLQDNPRAIDTLVYRIVTFHCNHGGNHDARPRLGKRSRKTLKVGCGARFTVNLKRDLRLHVTQIQPDHSGHEQSEESFNQLAINRRLPEEAHPEILRLVARGVRKADIRERMERKYNKQVTRDGLNNLLRKLNRAKDGSGWDELAKDCDDYSEEEVPWDEEESEDDDYGDAAPMDDDDDDGDDDDVWQVFVKQEDGPEINAGSLRHKHIPKGVNVQTQRLLKLRDIEDDSKPRARDERGSGDPEDTSVILEAVQGAGALEGTGDDPAAAETPTAGQQGAPSGSGGGDGGETSGADLGQAESGQPECSVSMEEGEELEVNLEGEITKDYYFQKYKTEWEHLPEFRGWLAPVPNDVYKAECTVCNTYLRCHKLKLRQHASSKKHHMSMSFGASHRRRRQMPPPAITSRAERRSFGRKAGRSPARGRGRGVTTRRSYAAAGGQAEQGQGRRAVPAPQDVSYGDMGRVTYSIGLGGNKVGFIGAGTIAQAIAQAILDKGVIHSGRLTVSAPSPRHLSTWSSWGCAVTNCNDAVMQSCHVVFLCVPPSAALSVLHALTPNPEIGERCFISVVPGLSRERIETILASKFVPQCEPGDVQTLGSLYVVRCMVNLAIRSGAGCCAYSVPANLPDRWLLCLEVMCGAMGVSQPLDDARLDAFAASISPGPAVMLAVCEALAMGAASAGLPWDIARKMAAQTLVGAGQLLLDADSQTALHDQAAPPGDPTLAALVALQRTDIKSGVASAVQAFQKAMRAPFSD